MDEYQSFLPFYFYTISTKYLYLLILCCIPVKFNKPFPTNQFDVDSIPKSFLTLSIANYVKNKRIVLILIIRS